MKRSANLLLCLWAGLLLAACVPGYALPIDQAIAQRDAANASIAQATAQAASLKATDQSALAGTAAALAGQMEGTAAAGTQVAAAATLQAEQTRTAFDAVERAGQMTAQADQATATAVSQEILDAIYFNSLATAQAAQAQVAVNEAAKSTLEAERAAMTNRLLAYTPYIFLAILIGLGVWVYYRETRVRQVNRDSNGDAPLLIVDGDIYDADRTPGARTVTAKALPAPVYTSEDVRAVVERDQTLDLGRAASRMAAPGVDLLKQYQKTATDPWRLLTAQTGPVVEMIEPGDPRYAMIEPVLEDVTKQLESQ